MLSPLPPAPGADLLKWRSGTRAVRETGVMLWGGEQEVVLKRSVGVRAIMGDEMKEEGRGPLEPTSSSMQRGQLLWVRGGRGLPSQDTGNDYGARSRIITQITEL